MHVFLVKFLKKLAPGFVLIDFAQGWRTSLKEIFR